MAKSSYTSENDLSNLYTKEVLDCLRLVREEIVDKYLVVASNGNPENPLCTYHQAHVFGITYGKTEHSDNCLAVTAARKLVRIGFIKPYPWMLKEKEKEKTDEQT